MDNQHFSLKEQLEEMRREIKKLSSDILELTIINKHTYEERQANSIKLEKLDAEFTQAKGAISTLKWLISVFGASAIAFCTWIVTSNNDHQKEIQQLTQKIALAEKDIMELQENEKTH